MPEFQGILDRFDMEFRPLQNDYVKRQLPPGEHLGTVTRDECDCGTVVGCLMGYDEAIRSIEQKFDKKIEQIDQLGWSGSKIEEWLSKQQREIDLERQERTEEERNREAEALRWVELVRELLQSRIAPQAGILVHEYSGLLTDERFKLAASKNVKLVHFRPRHIMELPEDTLLRVTR